MGQYYRALLRASGDYTSFLSPCSTDDLSKLMEHSWVGNDFVDAVMMELRDNPMRVAWMGDYADEAYKENKGKGSSFIATKEQFTSLYDRVWGENPEGEMTGVHVPSREARGGDDYLDSKKGMETYMTCLPRYLINNTQKVYIDMEEYIERCRFQETSGDTIWTMCIAPLPLLTAVGNGRGGGDYRGKNMELVGSWAFDEILTSNMKPGKEYTPVTELVFFDEAR